MTVPSSEIVSNIYLTNPLVALQAKNYYIKRLAETIQGSQLKKGESALKVLATEAARLHDVAPESDLATEKTALLTDLGMVAILEGQPTLRTTFAQSAINALAKMHQADVTKL